MKTKTLFLSIVLISMAVTCFSQTATIKLQYFANQTDHPDLGFCSEEILICINETSANAYYINFCDALGGKESFLSGHLKGYEISGTRYALLTNEDGDLMGTDESKFKIEIRPDAEGNNFITYYPAIDVENSNLYSSNLYSGKCIYSFGGGVKNFRELPSTSAKVISKIDVQKTKVSLIEIGKCEKNGQSFDFWYKVKIDNTEGWLFGGLILE